MAKEELKTPRGDCVCNSSRPDLHATDPMLHWGVTLLEAEGCKLHLIPDLQAADPMLHWDVTLLEVEGCNMQSWLTHT